MKLALLHEEMRRYHSKKPDQKAAVVEATVVPPTIHQGHHFNDYTRLSAYCARGNTMSCWRCQVDWCECDCHDATGYGV